MGRLGMGAQLLLLAATACALFGTGAYAAPVEISSSVITFHSGDLYLRSDGGSLCTDMVARAAGYNARRLQFVLTNKWLPPAGNPYGVQYYACDDASGNYKEWDASCTALYTAGLKACFAAALKANFTQLVINPHLDDASSAGTWRNYLIFDPLKVYSKWNYRDAMLLPIVNALKATITPSTTVWFNFQGEMGATIFTYPASYTSLIPWVKSSIGKGNIKVGVAYNWATCLGYVNYMNVQGQFQPNIAAVQKLFNSLDFFGISAYAPIPAAPKPADLENAIKNMQNELAGIIDVSNLILTQKKTFFYSEYGMGGGGDPYGSSPASSIAQMVQRPDWGYFYGYTPAKDPWKSYLPQTASDPFRTWNRMYYDVTSQWLNTGGGPTFRIDGLFLWSTVSYDIQAISYVSTTSQGSFKDPVICQTIRGHNAGVNGGSVTPTPTPSPTVYKPTPSPTPSPSTTPTPTPTPSPVVSGSTSATVSVALWGQCGGKSGIAPAGSALVDAQWAKTACTGGAKCFRQDQYYWQCRMSAAAMPIQSQAVGHVDPSTISQAADDAAHKVIDPLIIASYYKQTRGRMADVKDGVEVVGESDVAVDVPVAQDVPAAEGDASADATSAPVDEATDNVDVYAVDVEAAADGTQDAAAASSDDLYTGDLTVEDAAAVDAQQADEVNFDNMYTADLTPDEQAAANDGTVAADAAGDAAVAAE